MLPQHSRNLLLLGTGEPHITFLKGAQWGPESTQETFKGARWMFFPMGTFTFTPPPTANVRDDLYTISGTYTTDGNIFEFQGEKKSPLGATASMDGMLYLQEENIRVEVLYTVSSLSQKIASVTQTLFW